MHVHGVGKRLLTLILLTVVLSAIAVSYRASFSSAVQVLVRSADGARAVYTLSVPHGSLSLNTSRGTDTSPTVTQQFQLDDGSSILVEKAGIVSRTPGSNFFRVLVASPVVATTRTPIAEWGDGALLAWVNPGDSSLQVFQKTARGSYAPLYVQQGLHPNSFQFTKSGETLVVAKIVGESTDLYEISLESGTIERFKTVEGLVTVLPPL